MGGNIDMICLTSETSDIEDAQILLEENSELA